MRRFSPLDKKYMAMALSLAERGRGRTSPNPTVGAVLVKKGKVTASAYHKKSGTPHAEVLAIKKAGRDVQGSTLYCTLEACTHYGKTPPCINTIIESGIKRAVFAMKDPNPVNDGEGIAALRRSGIETECGLFEDKAKKLNRPFIKFIKKHLPYITIKIAESLDGKTADETGDSKWISSEESRRLVHKLRAENDAVMVGVNTVIKDNPLLNNRYYRALKKQPLRIILDTDLRTPLKSRILKVRGNCGPLLIAGGVGASSKKKASLQRKGAKVILLARKDERIRLMPLLKYLYREGIISILCEGGSELVASLVSARLADEAYFFISPTIIGGRRSPTACGGERRLMKDHARLKNVEIGTVGPDIMIRGDF